MNIIKKNFYWIVALAVIVALIFQIELLNQISKPLLMIALLVFFWSQSDNRKNERWVKFVTLALVFSWLGDVVLMFTHLNFLLFFAGLSAFLVAHIVYIFAFVKATNKGKLTIKLSIVPIFFLVFFTLLGYLILPYVDAVIQVPITVYAFVLLLMVSAAFFRKGNTNLLSFQWVFVGAILFIVSDSLLAINRFSQTIPYANIAVMVTYIIAQWMIVKGLLYHRPIDS